MPLTDPVHISPKYVYERGTNLQNLTFGPPIKDNNSSKINFYIKSTNQNGEIEYRLPLHPISLADIYEDQVNGWFFNIVLDAFKGKDNDVGDAGFIVLMTALSFFEAHAQFLYGKDTNRGSTKYFKKCFKVIFPASTTFGFSKKQSDKVARVFYQNLRNGLFHTAMIRQGIELNRTLKQPFKVKWNPNDKIQFIIVNPLLFTEAVQQYFSSYIQTLNQDATLKKNLQKGWSFLFDYSSEFIDTTNNMQVNPSIPYSQNSIYQNLNSDAAGTATYVPKSEIDS